MSYPPPPPQWQGGPPSTTTTGAPYGEPVSGLRAWSAGLLDWIALAGFFVFWFGLGILLAESDDDRSTLFIGLGIGIGILGAVVCLFVEARLAVRHGSTAGHFLLGVRRDPAVSIGYIVALESFLEFWYDTVLGTLGRLVDRVFPSRRDGAAAGTGLVRDPRSQSAGGRCARVVLALLIIVSPVPLVLAILA
ncbi:hypothetical protein [Nocardioides sp. Soil796]|uniref:hypothetical protein n=1 Tax=Nocardioides sp. Soil796 TaxID=1736412 RepID=UPI00070BE95A|nr:hypothetical protein [Nocardioides sp. Soil796]KRF11833.1 hypothetical protein ASH02_17850 [Nocardioides sp. Soil796]